MEPIELTELIELRNNMLIELRKIILIKRGAYRAYRAHGAEKEYTYRV